MSLQYRDINSGSLDLSTLLAVLFSLINGGTSFHDRGDNA